MSFQLGYKIRKIGKLVCFNINRKKLSLFISNFFVVELSRFQSRGEMKSGPKYNITFTKRFFFSPFLLLDMDIFEMIIKCVNLIIILAPSSKNR